MGPLHGMRTLPPPLPYISQSPEEAVTCGRSLPCLSEQKLSCNIFTFIPTNSIKAAEMRESIRSASYLTTQLRPLSLLQLSNPSIFQPSPTCTFFQAGATADCIGSWDSLCLSCAPACPSAVSQAAAGSGVRGVGRQQVWVHLARSQDFISSL